MMITAASSSALAFSLPEGDQFPRAIRHGCPVTKDVEVAIVGPDSIGNAFRLVPLIEHLFDDVLPPVHGKARRPLVGFSAGIALHIQFHRTYILTQSRDSYSDKYFAW